MRLDGWQRTATALREAVDKRRGDLYLFDRFAVLSHGDESIRVHDAGDDGVVIEAGWTIRLVADCEEHDDRPSQAIEIVEAIMDGGALETARFTSDNEWVGVTYTIKTPYGRRSAGPSDEPYGGQSATRVLPPWT